MFARLGGPTTLEKVASGPTVLLHRPVPGCSPGSSIWGCSRSSLRHLRREVSRRREAMQLVKRLSCPASGRARWAAEAKDETEPPAAEVE